MEIDKLTGLVIAVRQVPLKTRRVLSEDTAMNYDEWSQANYFIGKGEKSEIRDILGVPQFTIEQVKKKTYR